MRRSARPIPLLAAGVALAAPSLTGVGPAAAIPPPPPVCGSTGFGTWAQAVTDHGLVIGVSCAQTRKGRTIPLTAPPKSAGRDVEATAVSQSGHIAGLVSEPDGPRPAVWSSPTAEPQVLPLPAGTTNANATGIDDLGHVLVQAFSLETRTDSTWIWQDAGYLTLSDYTRGALTTARFLNARGELLEPADGHAADAGRIWTGDRMVPLQVPAGCITASANGFADDGTAVGGCVSAATSLAQPVSWDAHGRPHLLRLPAGYTSGTAMGAGRHGYVAGTLFSNFRAGGEGGPSFDVTAVAWHHGRPTILATDGSAYAVNSKGEVVGFTGQEFDRTLAVWSRHSW